MRKSEITQTTSQVVNTNEILQEMDEQIQVQGLELENGHTEIMRILSYWIEQEARYQRQVEPLYLELELTQGFIKESLDKQTELINIKKIEALYLEQLNALREDFILGRIEFFKSRPRYYDKKLAMQILLDQEKRKTLEREFIQELDCDLSLHRRRFLERVPLLATLANLILYEKELKKDIHDLKIDYEKIIDIKEPHMQRFSDLTELYRNKVEEIVYKALFEAAKKNDIFACQKIITRYKDLNINRQDKGGFSLLHLATDPVLINLLLKEGINTELSLNYTEPLDHRGWTPLHWHAFYCRIAIVQLLLEAGADPDAKSALDVTPLFLSAKIAPLVHKKLVNEEIVGLLMEYGANIRSRNVSAKDNRKNFAMGCYATHDSRLDSLIPGTENFRNTSRFTEEKLGEQAARGMQAWHMTQKQQLELEKIKEQQNQDRHAIDELVKDNELLQSQFIEFMNFIKDETPIAQSVVNSKNKTSLTSIVAACTQIGFLSEPTTTTTSLPRIEKQKRIEEPSSSIEKEGKDTLLLTDTYRK